METSSVHPSIGNAIILSIHKKGGKIERTNYKKLDFLVKTCSSKENNLQKFEVKKIFDSTNVNFVCYHYDFVLFELKKKLTK